MIEKNVNLITKVLGILFMIFSIFYAATSLFILVATGATEYGQELIQKMDSTYVKNYPTAVAIFWIVFIAFLAFLYFKTSKSLLNKTKTAPRNLMILGVVAILSGVGSIFFNRNIGLMDFISGVVYILLSGVFARREDIFKN